MFEYCLTRVLQEETVRVKSAEEVWGAGQQKQAQTVANADGKEHSAYLYSIASLIAISTYDEGREEADSLSSSVSCPD